jgi:hypothetical protein
MMMMMMMVDPLTGIWLVTLYVTVLQFVCAHSKVPLVPTVVAPVVNFITGFKNPDVSGMGVAPLRGFQLKATPETKTCSPGHDWRSDDSQSQTH